MENPRFQFVMVKPKAVELDFTENFFEEFNKEGLILVWQKRVQLTREQIDFLYRPYKRAHWFEGFAEIMTGSDSVIAIWMGGDDIIEITFEIRERIREQYKKLIEFYDLHAADSEEIAISQLKFLIGKEVFDIMAQATQKKG